MDGKLHLNVDPRDKHQIIAECVRCCRLTAKSLSGTARDGVIQGLPGDDQLRLGFHKNSCCARRRKLRAWDGLGLSVMKVTPAIPKCLREREWIDLGCYAIVNGHRLKGMLNNCKNNLWILLQQLRQQCRPSFILSKSDRHANSTGRKFSTSSLGLDVLDCLQPWLQHLPCLGSQSL